MAYVPPHKRMAFSTMASNWQAADDRAAEKAINDRIREVKESGHIPVSMANLYRLRKQTPIVEEEEEVPQVVHNNDEGWTVVEKKPKRRNMKTLEQRLEEEEAEKKRQEEEDSNMWVTDDVQEHETYWDQRR